MPAETIIIRADADTTVGTGHVMRCLALAQQWRAGGGRAVFLSAHLPAGIAARLTAEAFEHRVLGAAAGEEDDARETVGLAGALGAGWVVADGYGFGTIWQRIVKDAALRLLVLDDFGHAGHYHADLVLNQNQSASARLYAGKDAATHLLLGPRFALLRQEFVVTAPLERTAQLPRRILVTLGGSDSANVTRLVIEALKNCSDLEVLVVVGAGNPHLGSLESLVSALAGNIRLEVNPPSMAALMRWADLAITAGGSTVWETARLGLPALTIVIAENQAPIARALHVHGSVVNLGEAGDLTPQTIAGVVRGLRHDPVKLEKMSRLGRQLVDGLGAERVVAALEACA